MREPGDETEWEERFEPRPVFETFSMPAPVDIAAAWHPVTADERDGAHWFREIIHAHQEASTWPLLPPRAKVAIDEFGGTDVLALLDKESILMARATFVALYCKGQPEESAAADPNDIPADYKLAQAGDDGGED